MKRVKDWLLRCSPPPSLILMILLLGMYVAFVIGFAAGWSKN
jgi:hypothetical protein